MTGPFFVSHGRLGRVQSVAEFRKKPLRQVYAFLVIGTVVFVHGGCQPKDDVARSSDDVQQAADPESEAADAKSKATADKVVDSSKVDATAVEDEYVVPGINFAPPPDDAVADGWQTEKYASLAGKGLKLLASRFPGAEKSDSPSATTVASVVDPEISFRPLRPESIETVFQDAAFTVGRDASRSNPARIVAVNRGAAVFMEGLESVLNFVSNPTEVKTKVKIVKVEQQEQQLITSAYMQTWGTSDDGAFQSNATWDCTWRVHDSHVTLLDLQIRDYVEVVGANTDSGGPMFVDCTESVLGGTPAFREQLVPGMDQWLHLIEIQYHINIGGWEGMSISDVNGDGLDDLYVCQPGGLPNRLFVHNEDGTCRDVSAESGTDWLNESHGSVFGDIDNDGDQDLIVGVHDGLLVMSNDGSGNLR